MGDEKTLKQIIREELGKLAKLSWGQRFVYIWDYYKPLMAVILGIIFLISIGVTIYHNMQLEYLLNVYFINSNALELDSNVLTAEFEEYLGGIGEKEVVTVDTTIDLTDDTSQYGIAAQMKMTAMIAAKSIDLLVVDESTFEQYMEQAYFADLTDIFTEEQLEEWSDLLLTADGTKVSEADGDAAVYALDLTEAPGVTRYNTYYGNKAYGVVAVNAQHLDLCDEFFSFMLEE